MQWGYAYDVPCARLRPRGRAERAAHPRSPDATGAAGNGARGGRRRYRPPGDSGRSPEPLPSFCTAIGTHHAGEDSQLFPALAAAVPELAPMIGKLMEDHALVAGILQQVRALLAPDRPAAAPGVLLRELDGLTAILESHFSFEERRIAASLDTLGPDALTADLRPVSGELPTASSPTFTCGSLALKCHRPSGLRAALGPNSEDSGSVCTRQRARRSIVMPAGLARSSCVTPATARPCCRRDQPEPGVIRWTTPPFTGRSGPPAHSGEIRAFAPGEQVVVFALVLGESRGGLEGQPGVGRSPEPGQQVAAYGVER